MKKNEKCTLFLGILICFLLVGCKTSPVPEAKPYFLFDDFVDKVYCGDLDRNEIIKTYIQDQPGGQTIPSYLHAEAITLYAAACEDYTNITGDSVICINWSYDPGVENTDPESITLSVQWEGGSMFTYTHTVDIWQHWK